MNKKLQKILSLVFFFKKKIRRVYGKINVKMKFEECSFLGMKKEFDD